MSRLTWPQYALLIARVASLRSEDPYKKVGSCALRFDKSIAGVGYNGAPKNIEIDWSNRDERRKRVIHSEINCLSYCRPSEIWLLACTMLPCRSCFQVIASYNIKIVIYNEIYDKDDFTIQLAKEWGIELIQLDYP